MKRLIALMLTAVLCIGVCAGCSKKEENSAEQTTAADSLARIKEKGEITIAMEGTWSPWTYHDESDKLVGFDVEIGQYIADYLGVKAVFVEGEWDGLLAGLDAGRYDIMVNGVDITEDRNAKYYFSEPYAYNRTAVIVTGDNTSITKMEDLNGKNTANTISSTYAEVAEKYGAKVDGVDDLNQTFELLLAGRIDATLNAEVTFYDYMAAHPDANAKIACLDPEVTSVAIPMKRFAENDTLLAEVNKALAEMQSNGKLTELSNKYFGGDITKK